MCCVRPPDFFPNPSLSFPAASPLTADFSQIATLHPTCPPPIPPPPTPPPPPCWLVGSCAVTSQSFFPIKVGSRVSLSRFSCRIHTVGSSSLSQHAMLPARISLRSQNDTAPHAAQLQSPLSLAFPSMTSPTVPSYGRAQLEFARRGFAHFPGPFA